MISHVERLGIEVVHQYGSSECYGPATVAWRRPEWDVMSFEQRATLMAQQGTPTPVVDDLMVADPVGMRPVAKDGNSLGEMMLRGNTVMQGYFSDDMSSSDPLAGGWFHTGDMAVWHADGTIEIKDRTTDVINPAGDLMSSVEIEDVLNMHPAIQEAAVVGLADEAAGEVPCAFVTTVRKAATDAAELAEFCHGHLKEAQIPRKFVFGDLPKTQTGKVKKFELREMIQQLAGAEC
jgi:fatty-acyl-CoA synthase